MTRNIVIAAVIFLALVILGWIVAVLPAPSASEPSVPDNGSVSSEEDSAVRAVVTSFGAHMQYVPLTASAAERKKAMDMHYASFVAPELLAKWSAGSSDALGRMTSSPWPERIEIGNVQKSGVNYTVEGNVIEVTSAEAGTGKSAAGIYPVTLTLENKAGIWQIISASKGAYSELPRSQSIVGVWECLPHKDRTGPQTMECAFGILSLQGGHYAIDTRLMSTYPVDFPTGTRLRITGKITPVEALSSIQKYDIKGIISATAIEKI